MDFKNIHRLSGLKLEGYSKVTGSTQGNSRAATFNMNLDATDFNFEDFLLGHVSGSLSYAKSVLNFQNLSGGIGGSTYGAEVSVDLKKPEITAEGSSTHLEIPDLLRVLSRKFTLPISVTGAGSAHVRLQGPLKLGQLSYDLQASVTQGMAAGESFDRAEIVLNSKQGEVRVAKGILNKGNATILVSGQGHPNGNIDGKIVGNGFHLEESENVSKLGAQISGLFNFSMTMNGFILTPDTYFKGTLTGLTVEEQEFAPSDFTLKFTRNSIDGVTSLFGDRLKSEFQFPINPQLSPFKLRVHAKDWNFTTVFALLGGGNLLSDYQAGLSGDLNLEAEKGGFFKSTGSGVIRNLFLARNQESLRNQGPPGAQYEKWDCLFEKFSTFR